MKHSSPFTAPDARITPWTNDLREDQFILNCAKLDSDAVERSKSLLERYGVCVIRRSGAGFTTNRPAIADGPTESGALDPNIALLQEMLGPASGEQSEASGSTSKLIVTNPSSDELAGNFPGTLNPHADGTHLPTQPPIVILQYLITADVGGALRFVDVAGLLHDLFIKDAEATWEMVRALQRFNAVSVTKPLPDGTSVTNEAPFLFRTAYAAVNSLGCRGRFDSKVEAHSEVRPHFEKLRTMVAEDKFRVSFMPQPGDVVLLDNWRVLHGRGHYSTVGPRAHRRAWIESLYPTVHGRMMLGIRPLAAWVQEEVKSFAELRGENVTALLTTLAADESILLAPKLIEVGTEESNRVLVKIFEKAEDSQTFHHLKPSPELASVRSWALAHWRQFTEKGETRSSKHHWRFPDENVTNTLAWLLDKDWNDSDGADAVFNELVRQTCADEDWERLPELYRMSYRFFRSSREIKDRFETGRKEIERIVLNSSFAPELKKGDSRTSKHIARDDVRLAAFERRLRCRDYKTIVDIVVEAEANTAYHDYWEVAIDHLLDEYRTRSFLTIDGSSSNYDPAKAKEIVDALATIKSSNGHYALFRAYSELNDKRRGWLGAFDERKIMEEGLFKPLWWRLPTEMRIKYWNDRNHMKFREQSPFESGPELLLTDLMGLTYDPDSEFRREFRASLSSFHYIGKQYGDEPQAYEPRGLQELWRGLDLKFELSDEVPPELARRIAVTRNDWENSTKADVRWVEAKDRAQKAFSEGQLDQWISSEKQTFAVDNLLGAYFPSERRVVLYRGMIAHVAKELKLDDDPLTTVIFIHESVHAFSHLGRDLDHAYWRTFAIPLADSIDGTPSVMHGTIAQYFTFKLIERLEDKRLMATFLALEQACSEVYRAWRSRAGDSLEQMRQTLMECRRTAE